MNQMLKHHTGEQRDSVIVYGSKMNKVWQFLTLHGRVRMLADEKERQAKLRLSFVARLEFG